MTKTLNVKHRKRSGFTMTAFFVASSRVKNPEKFKEYGAKAGATFAAFGGKPAFRGTAEESLVGDNDHHAVGVVTFPDMSSLKNWYDSDAYQQLVPLRDEAVDMTLTTYSVPT